MKEKHTAGSKTPAKTVKIKNSTPGKSRPKRNYRKASTITFQPAPDVEAELELLMKGAPIGERGYRTALLNEALRRALKQAADGRQAAHTALKQSRSSKVD